VQEIADFEWWRSLFLAVFGIIICQSNDPLIGKSIAHLLYITTSMPAKACFFLPSKAAALVEDAKTKESSPAVDGKKYDSKKKTKLKKPADRLSDGAAQGIQSMVLEDAVGMAASSSRADQFALSGQRLFEQMDETNKQKILLAAGKSEAELWTSIGYLEHVKTLRRPLGDAGLQKESAETITIDFIQSGADMEYVLKILKLIEPELNDRSIIANGHLRPANFRENGKPVHWHSAKIEEFAATEKLLDVISGRTDPPTAMKAWFFRRDFTDSFGTRMSSSIEMGKFLQVASLLGLTRPQVEFILMDSLNHLWRATSLENTVTAVVLADLKYPRSTSGSGQLGRVTPFAMDYSELNRIDVYFRNAQAVDNLRALSEPITLLLGGDHGEDALQATVTLVPIKSQQQRTALWESWEQETIDEAKSAAKADSPATEVVIVRARLDVSYTAAYKTGKKLSLAGLQRALAEALGGVPTGLHSVAIRTCDQYRARFDLGVTICLHETPGTVWTRVLTNRLQSKDAQYLEGKVFASIRTKGEVTVARLSEASPAEEDELSIGEVTRELKKWLLDNGPLFIPKITTSRGLVEWEATGDAQQTALDQILGPVDRILKIDERSYRDVRTIFSGKVTSSILFPALLRMRDLEIYIYEGSAGVADFAFYEIYHPRKDPYCSEQAAVMELSA
jgi:hypothetical protein